MNINKLVIPLHMLTMSSMFPSLLSLIIIIVYKIFFDPATLCDDGCAPLLLEQLKHNLREEINKSDSITANIVEFNKIIQEIRESSEANSTQLRYNYNKIIDLQDMLIKSLRRATDIKTNIEKIDPMFTVGNNNINAGIFRILEQNRR